MPLSVAAACRDFAMRSRKPGFGPLNGARPGPAVRKTVPPAGCARFPGVRLDRRIHAPLAAVLVAVSVLVLSPAAFGADGEGTAGRIDDAYITFFCFAVIAFFAVLVTVLSLIQGRLDAKKEQRRHDLDRFNS